MNLVKTSFLNGIAVVVRLSSTILLNKVMAVHVAPSGYAVIGQFQNLVALVTTIASGAVGTGVTKFTAEYRDDAPRRLLIWRSAVGVSLAGAAIVALALALASRPLARWTLGDESFSSVILWLAGALVLLVFNGLMLAVLNGLKAVRAYVAASLAGSLVTLGVAAVLVTRLGLYGALLALCVSQAMACLATAILFVRHCPVRLRDLFGVIDGASARRLGAYALMGLTSALMLPLGQLLVRDGLVARLGWQQAGLWQALSKLSETHLMLLTTTLSLYFLPRFAEIRDGTALREEVLKGYRFVLPLVLCSSLAIYLLREHLVRALFTASFLPLSEALGIQLLGDILKIGSWVMAYTLLSHARTRTFVVSEVAFTAVLVVATNELSARFGLRGAAAGYALTYALYWLAMGRLFMTLTTELGHHPPQAEHPEAR